MALAVTTLVVVAFTGPLAVLVRRQADERARAAAERDAQTLAADVVRIVTANGGNIDLAQIASGVELPPGFSIVNQAGDTVGEAGVASDLVMKALTDRQPLSTYTDEGWELALPVITRTGSVAIRAQIAEAELRRGVWPAWAILAGTGLGLVAAALFVAERIGRSLIEPINALAEAAGRLGDGDLDTRVTVTDPEELRVVADAFNLLAPQLRNLLLAEREAMADLSHRLRTPLTALRLQGEAVSDPEDRAAVMAQVDRMERAVDQLIVEVRRAERATSSDLAEVATRHSRFWQVLADDQNRRFVIELGEDPVLIPANPAEAGAVVDALIGNVFDHTPPGTEFGIRLDRTGSDVVLSVWDRGRGFDPGLDPVERGISPGGSTGLGLDIALRLAQRCGGKLEVGNLPEGGAWVSLGLPIPT